MRVFAVADTCGIVSGTGAASTTGPVEALPKPRIRRRKGQTVRLYRRAIERWALYAFAIFVLAISLGPIVPGLDHGGYSGRQWTGLVFVSMVLLCIPGALLWWNRRLGVEVSSEGVRDVAVNGTRFTAWRDIDEFVLEDHTAFSSCIAIKDPKGAVKPLRSLAPWSMWRTDLEPYRVALNDELANARTGSP
jgi:hypothetical protein